MKLNVRACVTGSLMMTSLITCSVYLSTSAFQLCRILESFWSRSGVDTKWNQDMLCHTFISPYQSYDSLMPQNVILITMRECK